jgi:hypothetical protein
MSAPPQPDKAAESPAPQSLLRALARECFALDLRSLALFRVALALVLLADLAGRWPDLAAHYSDDGVLPRSLIVVNVPVSVHALGGSAAYERLVFLLAGAVAVALLLGYRTQLATFLSWLLLLSLHARNPLVLHGGDLLERLLLFWGIFLPLGARCSLDAARAGEGAPPAHTSVCSVATVALVLQIVFLYWFGLAARRHPAWWGGATAVADALSLDGYATPLGRWMRGLPPGLLRAATVATVAVEGAGPLVLLLSGGLGPVRTALVALFLAFHALLGLSLRLGTFSLVCMVAWLPFLPAWFWDTLLARRRPAPSPPTAGRPSPGAPGLSPLAGAVVLLSLAYVFLYNLEALRTGFTLAHVKGVGLEQGWGMFAPYPSRLDGWYVAEARLKDGREVDPFRGGPVSWDKPEPISATYPSARWAAYLFLLPRPEYAPLRPYFAEYLGRRWDAEHGPAEAVESVEVYYMLRYIRPDYTATPPEKVLLWPAGPGGPPP